MPSRIVLGLAACLAMPLASVATAQQPAGDRTPRRITEKPQEFPAAFTSVRSVTSLPDGRLVVTDVEEKKVLLLDFAKGTATPLGRSGTGPREYQDPGGASRAPGGGVVVYDQRQRRFLPVTTTGQVQDVLALPFQPQSWGSSSEGPDTFVPDTLGNLFTVGQPRRAADSRDSLPLLRIDRHGAIADTLGYLRQQEVRALASPSSNVTMQQLVAFSPRDAWAVAPDGAVAIVKAVPYRIDWYSPNKGVVHGPIIPFTPLRTTGADRDSLRARLNGGSTARVTGRGQTQTVRPGATEPILKDVKPPFPGQLPRIDEQGRLWVERSRTAAATRRSYDLFDRRGVLVDRVELPEGSRVVGFDARSLYTVRTDEDDLKHLQRFRLP